MYTIQDWETERAKQEEDDLFFSQYNDDDELNGYTDPNYDPNASDIEF